MIRTNGGHSSYHSWQTQVSEALYERLRPDRRIHLVEAARQRQRALHVQQHVPTVELAFGVWRAEAWKRAYPSTIARTSCRSDYHLRAAVHASRRRALLGQVIGGWQVAGITIFESGVPYSVANGARLRWHRRRKSRGPESRGQSGCTRTVGRVLGHESIRLYQSGRVRRRDGSLYLGADRSEGSSVHRSSRVSERRDFYVLVPGMPAGTRSVFLASTTGT